MSDTQTGTLEAAELNDESVAEFLSENSDFFERHPEALEHVTLQHASGSAVSLIERQIDILRSRNQKLQSRLTSLLENARENESRVRQINNLSRVLIAARNPQEVAAGLQTCMAQDFRVDAVFLGLRGEGQADADSALRYLAEDDAILETEENFFRMGQVICGPLSQDQNSRFFAGRSESKPLRSAAFVPLGKPITAGMLVLASCDEDRFTPEMGTLFLELIADLVATALRDELQEVAAP